MSVPELTRTETGGIATAVVVMLHGGTPDSEREVDGRSASWRRMAAMQRSLGPSLGQTGIDTWLVRYRERGWNGGAERVAEARETLGEVRRIHGDVPVVLLGHSMGARVAVHAAADHSVVGLVALAPWWGPEDPVRTLRSRIVTAAHGRRDRITSFHRTAAFVQRAREDGVDARLVDMGWRGHYLLTGVRRWNSTALGGVHAALGNCHQPAA